MGAEHGEYVRGLAVQVRVGSYPGPHAPNISTIPGPQPQTPPTHHHHLHAAVQVRDLENFVEVMRCMSVDHYLTCEQVTRCLAGLGRWCLAGLGRWVPG